MEQDVRVFPIFMGDRNIEPGESINDTFYWKIAQPIDKIVWVRLNLRVVSKGVEWNASYMIRVDDEKPASKIEVI